MNIVVRKIGNSEGIIIPKEVLDRVGVRAGDSLELREEDGRITLHPLEDDFQRQLAHAESFMDKYKVALKKLAE
ncbi:putative addiction module antidote [Neorhizobium galegae]|uniref:AbrB/MazE/SpoVT family DNA-binding domain-containing protein n=1 Tax=Neorhizobium galegae TaxID=399 RepID=UPI001AE48749|nr:AbrB/MazE/SpoVT family DNA-binding domain-containing protein [Neorhizobium galegae]MBP2547316.1 putative addiction module antidote [Neorhizobium galegae]